MRFYYQSQDSTSGQKVATKCIRVTSSATTREIIETLIEKFRPDMKMLEVPEYALYEIHESGERRLGLEEKPLLVQVRLILDLLVFSLLVFIFVYAPSIVEGINTIPWCELIAVL